MKQLSIFLTIIILTASSAISQISHDSTKTTIPNDQLKKAINLIEQGKVCKEEVFLLRQKSDSLWERLSLKDIEINLLKSKDTTSGKIIIVQKSIIDDQKKIISNQEEKFSLINKELNRQKPMKWIYAGAAVIITILLHK